MVSTPEEVWEEFENKKISQDTALELLITLVEKSRNEEVRIKAIKILNRLNFSNDYIFRVLENLLISDENEVIRSIVIQIIGTKFKEKAISPLEWTINHEKEYNNMISTIKWLGKIGTPNSKLILYNQIKKVVKTKYFNIERKIENKKFKKALKALLKEKSFEKFTSNELVKILINYYSIVNILKHVHNVFYELDLKTGLVTKLDLSDQQYEVKGTPYWWKNNLKTLSDVPGIENLTYTHYLDLSNNQIADIRELLNLPNLTHLILTNNKIDGEENLNYIKKLPNLKHLDLRGNNIIQIIKPNDFKPKIRVLLRNSYIEI